MLGVAAGRITLFTPRREGEVLVSVALTVGYPTPACAGHPALRCLDFPLAHQAANERPRFLLASLRIIPFGGAAQTASQIGQQHRRGADERRQDGEAHARLAATAVALLLEQLRAPGNQVAQKLTHHYFSIVRLLSGISPSACFWSARMLTWAAIALATLRNASDSGASGCEATTG